MRSAYAYDPYMAYGGVVAYGQQTVVAPHVMGGVAGAFYLTLVPIRPRSAW